MWRSSFADVCIHGRTPSGNLLWKEMMPARTLSLIREPEGIDLVVSCGRFDRQTALETAQWLAAYRRQHDQSAELQEALDVLRQATGRVGTSPKAAE